MALIANPRAQARLVRLVPVVRKELEYLLLTDRRLFAEPLTPERIQHLPADPDLGERVDAFAARFGRLQDTLGDKMLPAWLATHGEPLGTFADNLDRAQRLGLIDDAQTWIDMRRLRNQMVQEYVEDPVVLASALTAAHEYVPVLAAVAQRLMAEVE